jgi:citrate synthase
MMFWNKSQSLLDVRKKGRDMIIYNVRFKSNKAMKKRRFPARLGTRTCTRTVGLVTHCLWQPPSSADPLASLESII